MSIQPRRLQHVHPSHGALMSSLCSTLWMPSKSDAGELTTPLSEFTVCISIHVQHGISCVGSTALSAASCELNIKRNLSCSPITPDMQAATCKNHSDLLRSLRTVCQCTHRLFVEPAYSMPHLILDCIMYQCAAGTYWRCAKLSCSLVPKQSCQSLEGPEALIFPKAFLTSR